MRLCARRDFGLEQIYRCLNQKCNKMKMRYTFVLLCSSNGMPEVMHRIVDTAQWHSRLSLGFDMEFFANKKTHCCKAFCHQIPMLQVQQFNFKFFDFFPRFHFAVIISKMRIFVEFYPSTQYGGCHRHASADFSYFSREELNYFFLLFKHTVAQKKFHFIKCAGIGQCSGHWTCM